MNRCFYSLVGILIEFNVFTILQVSSNQPPLPFLACLCLPLQKQRSQNPSCLTRFPASKPLFRQGIDDPSGTPTLLDDMQEKVFTTPR